MAFRGYPQCHSRKAGTRGKSSPLVTDRCASLEAWHGEILWEWVCTPRRGKMGAAEELGSAGRSRRLKAGLRRFVPGVLFYGQNPFVRRSIRQRRPLRGERHTTKSSGVAGLRLVPEFPRPHHTGRADFPHPAYPDPSPGACAGRSCVTDRPGQGQPDVCKGLPLPEVGSGADCGAASGWPNACAHTN